MRAALDAAYSPGPRRACVALWCAGVLIAGGTAVDAWVRLGFVAALPFVFAAALLATFAVFTARGATWALALSLVGLGGQLFGVVGTAIELWVGVAPSKAHELRGLGVDPVLGVWLNLVYSAVAFALFLLLLRRLLRARAR